MKDAAAYAAPTESMDATWMAGEKADARPFLLPDPNLVRRSDWTLEAIQKDLFIIVVIQCRCFRKREGVSYSSSHGVLSPKM